MKQDMLLKKHSAATSRLFRFAQEGDPQAAELQKLIREKGVEPALDFVSQLRPWNPITKLIREELKRQVAH